MPFDGPNDARPSGVMARPEYLATLRECFGDLFPAGSVEPCPRTYAVIREIAEKAQTPGAKLRIPAPMRVITPQPVRSTASIMKCLLAGGHGRPLAPDA